MGTDERIRVHPSKRTQSIPSRAAGHAQLPGEHQGTEIGDLDKFTRVVMLFGVVNSAPGFDLPPGVINGACELLIEVFGDRADRRLPSRAGAGASRRIVLDRETHVGDRGALHPADVQSPTELAVGDPSPVRADDAVDQRRELRPWTQSCQGADP